MMFDTAVSSGVDVIDTIDDAVAVVTTLKKLGKLKTSGKDTNLYLVYDLGGFGCTCSVVQNNGADSIPTTIASSWTAKAGGAEFDAKIVQWLAQLFKDDTGIDLMLDSMAMFRLQDAAEKVDMPTNF